MTIKSSKGLRPVPSDFEWLRVKGFLQDVSGWNNETRWIYALFNGFSRSGKVASQSEVLSLEKQVRELRIDMTRSIDEFKALSSGLKRDIKALEARVKALE